MTPGPGRFRGASGRAVHFVGSNVRSAALELMRDWRAVGRFLTEPEVHVYAFSIAANVLLAFYPFVLVMLSISKHVFHNDAAINALFLAIRDYFAGDTGDTIVRNLARSLQQVRHMEWVSVLLLLFTANGVFLPLEVALNRAWGVTKGRNLLANQGVSTMLIFVCGALALLSAVVTGAAPIIWQAISDRPAPDLLDARLPGEGDLQARLDSVYVPDSVPGVLAAAEPQGAGGADLAARVRDRTATGGPKWINFAIWPWIRTKFQREYGGFADSITILTWSFFAGLIVLAGADWSARRARQAEALAAIEAGEGEPARG